MYQFLGVLWTLLANYLPSKVYAAADSLMAMTAEILSHTPLRMITDQVSTDPVETVMTALPNVVSDRLTESPHFSRPAHALWKVMRALLFNAAPEPPGRYERIVLRRALVPGGEVEPEDAFLAARYAEDRGKPIADLAVAMQKSDMLLRTADAAINAPTKNYVRLQPCACFTWGECGPVLTQGPKFLVLGSHSLPWPSHSGEPADWTWNVSPLDWLSKGCYSIESFPIVTAP